MENTDDNKCSTKDEKIMRSDDHGVSHGIQGPPCLPHNSRSDTCAEIQDSFADEVHSSAWSLVHSPMLTSLRSSHQSQFHNNSPAKRKRAYSVDDTHPRDLLLPPLQDHIVADISTEDEIDEHTDLSERQPQQPLKSEDDGEEGNSVAISIMYGLINATIVLPVLMSFGAIIYRDDAFSPYMNILIKLTVTSGVVHQICFSTLSSFPFAVGQVQDAGLIFLSGMAGMLVQYATKHDADDEALLATATVGLSLCTAVLGLALVGIGNLKLAQWVQKLPTCVVGGYLAYIGFFCGMSGIGLMARTSGDITWSILVENIEYILPGLLGGVFIYCLVRTLKHMAVLPTCIVFLFVLFYLVLWIKGISVEEATENGWISKTEPPPAWYHTWDYLRFDKVMWSALPQLLLTELSMIFVVALSSSLDIAAIELELKRPLDYNKELSMIGISNMVSGITGGYTGSYIFSQSIFNLRAGIRSRITGFFLALCEILYLLAPFSILAYVPCFFFGSLLTLICVDLMYEWLIESRHKLTSVEYGLCLATFSLILLFNVEYGIILGAVLYISCQKIGFLNQDTMEQEDACNSINVSTNGNNAANSSRNNYGAIDG